MSNDKGKASLYYLVVNVHKLQPSRLLVGADVQQRAVHHHNALILQDSTRGSVASQMSAADSQAMISYVAEFRVDDRAQTCSEQQRVIHKP